MFEFKIKGFKELERKMDELQRKAKALKGPQSISLTDLFPEDFMSKYTSYTSIDDMFQASGFVVESEEDFDKIPDNEWDNFIESNTHFHSWEEMREIAIKEWISRKLGL